MNKLVIASLLSTFPIVSAQTTATTALLWITLPIVVGLLFYMLTAMVVWPYARSIMPFYLILFAILIPPFFPFLLLYLGFTLCFVSYPAPLYYDERPVIVVVSDEPTKKGSKKINRMKDPKYMRR